MLKQSLFLLTFMTMCRYILSGWVSKDCSSGMWCLSCDDYEGECRSCHHKAYSTSESKVLSNGTTYDYVKCTRRDNLVNMCRGYESTTSDTGNCGTCESGFSLATNKTSCVNFTNSTTTCGDWCLSCSQTTTTPYYDSCNFCFPDFTVDTTDNTACLEANSTNANTGVYKCKVQQANTCSECKVGYALNYAGSTCTASDNLKCGKLFEDTIDECYECHHGYVMINNKTCS